MIEHVKVFAGLLLLPYIATSLDGEGARRPIDSGISRFLFFACVLLLTLSISTSLDDETCEAVGKPIDYEISSFILLRRILLVTPSISVSIDDRTCESVCRPIDSEISRLLCLPSVLLPP